jgi:hypothetical protein
MSKEVYLDCEILLKAVREYCCSCVICVTVVKCCKFVNIFGHSSH